jgi:hypothetical protein
MMQLGPEGYWVLAHEKLDNEKKYDLALPMKLDPENIDEFLLEKYEIGMRRERRKRTVLRFIFE